MEIKYIDVHTHLNLSAYDEDRDTVEENTLAEGVAHINVGTMRDSSLRAVALAHKYQGAYASVGLHPVHTSKSYHDRYEFTDMDKGFISRGEVFDADIYRKMCESEKVVAIGECGLDYFRVEKETRMRQESEFLAQIQLANELTLPLMLHIRPSKDTMDAYEDALKILKMYAKVRGNVHFFAGTYDIAKQFWEMGYTTSFTGVITFASQYDEVITRAPIDMLHAETDAPYVTPKPFRGQRNEPLHVREVYKRIAELRRADEESVRCILLENARRMFGIQI